MTYVSHSWFQATMLHTQSNSLHWSMYFVGFFSVEPNLVFFCPFILSCSEILQNTINCLIQPNPAKCSSHSREVTHTPYRALHNKATPGVAGAVLASSAKGKHGHMERAPKATRIMKGLDFPLGKGWGSWDCSAWRSEGSWIPHQCLQIPEGRV